MDHFHYRDRVLHCEDVPVPELAEHYGTPLYVYSQATLLHHLQADPERPSPRRIRSSATASRPTATSHICKLMAEHGSGFDVTSGGELYRALKAGGTGAEDRLRRRRQDRRRDAATASTTTSSCSTSRARKNCTPSARWPRRLGEVARVALRVNPDLPPKTHAKTDTSVKGVKFGLDIETVLEVAAGVVGHPDLKIVGLHMHLGSPILQPSRTARASTRPWPSSDSFRKQGHAIKYLNMGGGFGIHYRKQEALPASAFAEVILPAVEQTRCKLVLEPGRFIVGNAGILVSRVVFTKETGGKHYIIQDAAMNDLIRPTLYDSFHRIWPVSPARRGCRSRRRTSRPTSPARCKQDVVGPVCESGDFLAKDRHLPAMRAGRPAGGVQRRGVRHGDGLATTTAGCGRPKSSLQAARTA